MTICALLTCSVKGGGQWIPLATPSPNGDAIGTMLLLSDGTVMAQHFGNSSGVWYRLTPTNTGSYIYGSWTTLHSMNWPRLYYSSDVLKDGRVFVAGAEESFPGGGTTAEIYDPQNDSAGWTMLSVPNTLIRTNTDGFSDSQSVVLPNGNVLIAPVVPYSGGGTVIYDPVANTWEAGPASLVYLDEASWVKLPDDSILTTDTDNIHSERYIPSLNRWINDAVVPTNTFGSGEIGAAVLLPNGKAIFFGGSGHTVIYSPSGNTNNGMWAVGPDVPGGVGIADSPAAMMVNGKILCMVGSAEGNGGNHGPYTFYEYDYTIGSNGAFNLTSSPGNSTVGSVLNTTDCSCFYRFLDLPDGTILASFGPTLAGQLYIYKPDGSALAAGKPGITSLTQNADGSFHLTGTGLNGISEGAAFGDDAQMDSNYPLIRMTNSSSGNVYYARTYNWSSTSVMTGNKVVSTEFTLPPVLANPGTYSLVVVANGISSDPVTFYGPVWVQYGLSDPGNGTYNRPYNTLAQGTNAVPLGGTILFKYPGSTPEKPRLSKPMIIGAVGGPATIGR